MITRRASLVRGCAAVAATAILAAGCSSSTSSSTPSASGSSSPSSSSPATTAAPTSSAPAGGGPTDTAAATQAVTQMWQKYYDSTVDPTQKVSLVQNPAKVAGLLTALLAQTKGQKSSAQVTNVAFTDANDATVTFNIQLNGATVVSGVNGKAVYDPASGNWQVADQTLCSLAQLASIPAATLTAAGC